MVTFIHTTWTKCFVESESGTKKNVYILSFKIKNEERASRTQGKSPAATRPGWLDWLDWLYPVHREPGALPCQSPKAPSEQRARELRLEASELHWEQYNTRPSERSGPPPRPAPPKPAPRSVSKSEPASASADAAGNLSYTSDVLLARLLLQVARRLCSLLTEIVRPLLQTYISALGRISA